MSQEYTDATTAMLLEADALGYDIKVQPYAEPTGEVIAYVTVRLVPRTAFAKKRLKAAGREDRILEASAKVHMDPALLPFAVEAALAECLELHRTHLGLVLV